MQHVKDTCKDMEDVIQLFEVLGASNGRCALFDREFTAIELIEATKHCREVVWDKVKEKGHVKEKGSLDSDVHKWRLRH